MQPRTIGDVLGIEAKGDSRKLHDKALHYFCRILQTMLPESYVGKNPKTGSASRFNYSLRTPIMPKAFADIVVQTKNSSLCVELKMTADEDFLEPQSIISKAQQMQMQGMASDATLLLLTNMVVPDRMKDLLSDYHITTVDFDFDTPVDFVETKLHKAIMDGLHGMVPWDEYEPDGPSPSYTSNAELYTRFFTSELIPAVELALVSLRSQYRGGDNYVRFKRVGKYQRIYYSVVFRADNTVETELYIDTGNREQNLKHLYTDLAPHTARLQMLLPYEFRLDHIGATGRMRACRLGVRLPGRVQDFGEWMHFRAFALDVIQTFESECGPWIDSEYPRGRW